IRVLSGGDVRAEPLLDIRSQVLLGSEQGLLGLAFDGGRFVVDYTDLRGDTVVESYAFDAARLAGDAKSALRILLIHQPYPNHNGGMVAFGPDGLLYIGMGDGGSGGDPEDRALDTHDLLGKILRIDVSGTRGMDQIDAGGPSDTGPAAPYTIPPGNPFADGKAGAPEVWDYGLRNPWRFSFDRANGDLWIGDVGQDAWEEIDLEPAGSRGGVDYGWSAWEGSHRYDEGRDAPGAVLPVAEFSHAMGGSCAVTGGYVYRGEAIPALQGTYLYSDYCSGQLWALRQEGGAWNSGVVLGTGLRIVSFGEETTGELLAVDLDGGLYRIVA
ncbi:MAG: PQQ-dependent sugar dehydrogenase, partial [Halobacteriales archaeon]|nr:PQQ-dependent sugar dehydrogenase [Halobacteriales archaeon]